MLPLIGLIMNPLDTLFEDTPPPGSSRIAVVLGRFSPPTKGHYELINKVKSFIKANPELKLEANPVVIVIGNDKKEKTAEELLKNPLSIHERILFMKSSGLINGVKFMHATNAFEALTGLRKHDLEPIAIAAGTDRIDDYVRILDNYFKTADEKPIKHHRIHVARDEDAFASDKEVKSSSIDDTLSAMKNGEDPGIDQISGSLARRAAELGYKTEFARLVGLDHNNNLANALYAKVRKSIDQAKSSKE